MISGGVVRPWPALLQGRTGSASTARRPRRCAGLQLVGRRRDARLGDAHVPVAQLAGAAGQRAVDLDQQQPDVGFARIGLEIDLEKRARVDHGRPGGADLAAVVGLGGQVARSRCPAPPPPPTRQPGPGAAAVAARARPENHARVAEARRRRPARQLGARSARMRAITLSRPTSADTAGASRFIVSCSERYHCSSAADLGCSRR